MVDISNIFGQSPIARLQSHMQISCDCANELIPFFKEVLDENWPAARKIQKRISKLEHEADSIKKQLKLHLPKSLFLPIPRGDVLKLIDEQDRIANKAEDIAGIVIGRKIVLPEEIVSSYQIFIEDAVLTAKQANTAISEISKLFSTGFSGAEIKIISDMIVKLDQFEHNTDKQEISIRNKLFKIENKLPPIKCVFLYKLIEWTGDLADRAQGVGGQLQLLLAK